MEEWNLLQGLLLGLVQGLTEFIPISSTAHLRLVPAALGWGDPGAAFSAVLQLGTLGAVLLYFAGDIRSLTLAALRSLWSAEARRTDEARLAWSIALGTLPVTIFGLALKEPIHTYFRALPIIGVMLIAVAIFLHFADLKRQHQGATVVNALALKQQQQLSGMSLISIC